MDVAQSLKHCTLSVVLLSMSSLAFAHINNTSHVTSERKIPSKYYATLSLAGADNSLKADTLIPAPNPNPSYLLDQRINTNAGGNYFTDIGLEIGKNVAMSKRWSTQVGLAFYASTQQTLKGNYYQTPSEPPDLAYHYHLTTARFMLKTNFFYHATTKLSYFYGFGAGLGHIHTSALVMPTDGSVTPPKSKATAQNHLVASIDAGIDYAFNAKWHINGSFDELFLGNNKVAVDNTQKMLEVEQGKIQPWELKLGISYSF